MRGQRRRRIAEWKLEHHVIIPGFRAIVLAAL
jgi:hypothetical protein